MLTGKILAEGMGLKSSTITGWEDRTVKFGFVVLRVGKGQWRVERLEGKEGVAAKVRRKSQPAGRENAP